MAGDGLLVGRFQPFHQGHVTLIDHVRRTYRPDALFVVIGSSQASHTGRDPFTAGERFEMLLRVIRAERWTDLWPVPVADLHHHTLWVRHVESLFPSFSRVFTGDPLTRMLFEEAGYEVPKLPFFQRGSYQGTEIRRRMALGLPWQDAVPGAVRRFLEEIKGEERVRLLAGSEGPSGAPPTGDDETPGPSPPP